MSSRTIARKDPDHNPHPPYAGDKGFRHQPPAKLTRLLLTYAALADDEGVPPQLRDYAGTTVVELRQALGQAVAA